MKTVAIEDLMVECVLTFCENAAELGCPKDQEVDMWFRYLSYEDAYKVAEKMLEIGERNKKLNEDDKIMKKDKIIKMVEIELELDNDIIDKIIAYALEKIKSDNKALINYGVNLLLEEVAKTDGKCLGECKCSKKKKVTNKLKKKQTK